MKKYKIIATALTLVLATTLTAEAKTNAIETVEKINQTINVTQGANTENDEITGSQGGNALMTKETPTVFSKAIIKIQPGEIILQKPVEESEQKIGEVSGSISTTGDSGSLKSVMIETASGKPFVFIYGSVKEDTGVSTGKPPQKKNSGDKSLPVVTKTEAVTKFDEAMPIETQKPMVILEGKMFIEKKEVNVLPDVAIETASKEIAKQEVTVRKITIETSTKEDKEILVYQIRMESEGKILGIINTKVQTEVAINTEDGTVESVKKPWWSFIVF